MEWFAVPHGRVAQSAEHTPEKRGVRGSTPRSTTTKPQVDLTIRQGLSSFYGAAGDAITPPHRLEALHTRDDANRKYIVAAPEQGSRYPHDVAGEAFAGRADEALVVGVAGCDGGGRGPDV
jgi:hypothetical protein